MSLPGWRHAPSGVQVLEQYAHYAQSAVGRFGSKPDGSPAPGVRPLIKPLLALFHGEKGCRLWKRTLDAGMNSPASAAEIIQVVQPIDCMVVTASTLGCLELTFHPPQACARSGCSASLAGQEDVLAGWHWCLPAAMIACLFVLHACIADLCFL